MLFQELADSRREEKKMKAFASCLVLAYLAGVLAQPFPSNLKPTFSWSNERSADGNIQMAINFGSDQPVAILSHYNPIPIEADLSRSAVDPCIFKGHLENENDSEVLVTGGCPGDDTFDISMISSRYGNHRFNVNKGIAKTPRSPLGTTIIHKDGTTSIFRDRAIKTEYYEALRNKTNLNRAALPSAGFVFKIAIIYDKNWFAKYVTHDESINAARRVVANSQILFRWPSLTIPIQLEVASITFQNIDIPASYDTSKPSFGIDALAQFAKDSTVQSYHGLTTIGDSAGLGYVGGVCGPMNVRASVTANMGYSDLTTAEIFTHESGHNLGMSHDFVDPFATPKPIRRDRSGNTCTDINSVMDYYVTVQKWSTCSVQDLTDHYNSVVSDSGSFCMPLTSGTTPVNGNWGVWTAWSTCSKTCASGTQTRSRICNSPAPANGGATCVGSATESATCNTQSCTTIVVKLVGGSGPNEGVLYATNPATKIYGPVCDDYFDQNINGANVVCRQLGYARGASSVSCCSSRGAVPTNFSYDDVKCVGTESSLDNCPHLNAHDCGASEGLWITCAVAGK